MIDVRITLAALTKESEHLNAINDGFLYLAALAESRRRRTVSELFAALPEGLPVEIDDDQAREIEITIVSFIEACPNHPNVGASFRILLDLAGARLTDFFMRKLRFYLQQGEAHAVYQLCTVCEDLGYDVFRDGDGRFIASRSAMDAEANLGVARRFLEREAAEPGATDNPDGAQRLREDH